MEPILTTAGQAALKASVANAVGAGRRAVRAARLYGVVDPTWLALSDRDGNTVELTVPQAESLRQFLTSERVRPVTALLVTSLLAGDSEDALDVIRELLHGEAKRWNLEHTASWMDAFDAVWAALLATFDARLPRPADVDGYSEELNEMAAFIQTPLDAVTGDSSGRAFINRLVDLGSDLQRLLVVERITTAIAAGVLDGKHAPIIGHTDAGSGASFESLYVTRMLRSGHDGLERSSTEVAAPGRGYRAVILGNPGAGKSTLVSHVLTELASESSRRQGAILIRCRDYLSRGWSDSLLDFACKALRADYAISESSTALDDALILGKVTTVFDGLDEITDPYQRSDMVRRIQRFAARYPVASILVTSRTLGYSRAPLDPAIFSQYHLSDFTDDQIVEYATKWFTTRETADLVPAFIEESESVRDLRSNPLLLSLLCILYGARGALPRRRREIYSKCADLLFHTWDSRRRIAQPDDLPTYGYRLMQEIARWIYQSTAAQQGVEQQQIEKVVAVHLKDLGVNETEAELRAREFLEFCAERAWLLGAFGSNDFGQRIFHFTHKTFYEFFAAEALSRQAGDVVKIADQVTAAFTRDPTSVVAELLLQAYDERVVGGAKSAFVETCSRGADPALILRLMNGALLPERVRQMGFDKVLAPGRIPDQSAFDALVALDPNSFATFEKLMEGNGPALDFFARGWATRRLSGGGYFGTPVIAAAAEAAARRLSSTPVDQLAPHVLNWLVLEGEVRPEDADFSKLLAIPVKSDLAAGAVWTAITDVLGPARPSPGAVALLQHFVASVGHAQVYTFVAKGLLQSIKLRGGVEGAHLSTAIDPTDEPARLCYAAIAILAMMADEAQVEVDWLQARLASRTGSTRDLIAIRRWKVRGGERPSRAMAQQASDQAIFLPPWVRDWCDGTRDVLTADPRQEPRRPFPARAPRPTTNVRPGPPDRS